LPTHRWMLRFTSITRLPLTRTAFSTLCRPDARSISRVATGSARQFAAGGAGPRRGYAQGSRFSNTKKRQVEYAEPETDQRNNLSSFHQSRQQQQQQQQQYSPSAAFPAYTPGKREEEQQGTQWDSLTYGTVEHMRKVYGTLGIGIGIAAGASLFTMATPLVGMHPLIPGLVSLAPLMGLMYTNKHTHSATFRNGLFAAFTGLSGVAMAPLLKFAFAVSPALVPQALLITSGLFGAMTMLSLMAKPGATLRWGVPLGGGLIILMGAGLAGMFVPVTSAWYPILHSVSLYGGLALFTAYIAYDTQKMISEYEMGEDDHLKHAVDLFIDFKVIFSRVLSILMMSRD